MERERGRSWGEGEIVLYWLLVLALPFDQSGLIEGVYSTYMGIAGESEERCI